MTPEAAHVVELTESNQVLEADVLVPVPVLQLTDDVALPGFSTAAAAI